jgi:hypothetical protein
MRESRKIKNFTAGKANGLLLIAGKNEKGG